MQLEQITRNHPRTAQERQTTYFVVEDLENLSASVLYMAKIDDTGSSNYFTWMSDPQPAPDLEIKTPNSYCMVNTEIVIPSSSSSLLYLNSKFQELGGIENLNSSEMSLLLKKHFGK